MSVLLVSLAATSVVAAMALPWLFAIFRRQVEAAPIRVGPDVDGGFAGRRRKPR